MICPSSDAVDARAAATACLRGSYTSSTSSTRSDVTSTHLLTRRACVRGAQLRLVGDKFLGRRTRRERTHWLPYRWYSRRLNGYVPPAQRIGIWGACKPGQLDYSVASKQRIGIKGSLEQLAI